ncbi:MAG TPA: hypothetical protein VKX16_18315 [Chloroflexota bacterium]|nr:hypothetical protein [Chloroflexota bacterium]
MATSSSNLSSGKAVRGDRSKGDTEVMAGRIIAVGWLFWVAAFWIGQIVGAIAPAPAAYIAVLAAACLAAYAVLRWERIGAWMMVAASLLWLVVFPIVVSSSGGDNVVAATVVTFILFGAPGLVAGVLMLDGLRRLKVR